MSEKSVPETRSVDGDTRRQIMLMLLKHGQATASELAARLEMSAAGVRRHLDILVSEGLGESVDRRQRSAAPGRGRPGEILDDALAVACGEGAVRLVEVQRAGGKAMDAQTFLRGAKLGRGDFLS